MEKFLYKINILMDINTENFMVSFQAPHGISICRIPLSPQPNSPQTAHAWIIYIHEG
jgi:hypothetical protein